jgi:hypothetical protein
MEIVRVQGRKRNAQTMTCNDSFQPDSTVSAGPSVNRSRRPKVTLREVVLVDLTGEEETESAIIISEAEQEPRNPPPRAAESKRTAVAPSLRTSLQGERERKRKRKVEDQGEKRATS